MRRLIPMSACLVAAAMLAPSALAHAKALGISPRDGAILGTPPAEIRVSFDDVVRVGPGNTVVSNRGGSVLAGRPRVMGGGRELVLPLHRLGAGDYSVRWRIVSDDGHLEAGVLAFRVGSAVSATGVPRSVLQAEGASPPAVDVVLRWLYLTGILVAGGTALFLLLVSSAARRPAAATFALALVAVSIGGSSLLHTTHGGATRFGHVTDVAVLIAAGSAVAAVLSSLYPRLLVVAAGGSLALLAAPSIAGHALDAGQPRTLSFTTDFVHVIAAAFWIGGLLQLALLLRSGKAEGAARRYSRLALPAAIAIALSGCGRAVAELTAVSQLWSTGYGRAILVKGVLFVALVALGWLSRRRLGSAAPLLRSVSAELAVLAVLAGAVAVLTALRPGRDATAALPVATAAREVGPAPSPPLGSVVLARESRELAVALAVRPGRPLRLTATILGQSGQGVDGLDVEFIAGAGGHSRSSSGRPCGHGCYAATVRFAGPAQFAVDIGGAGPFRSVRFPRAGRWPPPRATAFLLRATRAFRGLRSVVFLERLASAPGSSIVTRWKLAAPNRVEYAIRGGAGGIVIGRRRWDRSLPNATWRVSETTLLPQPLAPWGSRIADARVLHQTPGRVTVSWVDPGVPAWFTATFDRRTARPIELSMTAAAHFMRHRYLGFNRKLQIKPPPRSHQ